jgi:PERQ amino acid-rich with GYF domain-containing protein
MGEYGLNGIYNPASYPILDSLASSRNAEPLPLNAYNQSPGLEPMLNYHNGHGGFHDNMLSNSTFGQPDYGRLGLVNEEISPLSHYNAFGGIVNNTVHGQAQFSQTSSPFLSHTNAQPNNLDPLESHPAANVDSPSDVQAESESSIQSPWQEIPDVSAPQHGASLDALHPSLRPPAPRASPWGNKIESPQQPTHAKDVSPWTSQAAVPDGWKGDSQHDRLTFSNVVQHNQQYLSNDAQAITTPESPNPQQEQINAVHTPSIENGPAVSSGSVQSSRDAVVSQLDQERRPDGTSVTPDTSGKIDTPAQAPAPKVAWSKEPGPSISLREIQEAETKKVEARKVAERVTRTNPAPAEVKDVQPFTASWGLPSSQAGARSTAPLKEVTPASSPSVPAPPAPVWTNTVKSNPAKKSMKEIQEEEERRKRLLAAKEPTLAAAARKAPLEPANKVGDQSCDEKLGY